jgi:hypothetical protein
LVFFVLKQLKAGGLFMNKLFSVILLSTVFAAPSAFADWSAIAYNSVNSTWGEGHGFPDLASAENAALGICGGGCSIVAWTSHDFVALATGDNGGWGTSGAQPTAAAAIAQAVSECQSATTNCAFTVWVSASSN